MTSQPGKAPGPKTERRYRRYPRYRTEFPVTAALLSGNQYEKLDAHCKDISEAGIGLLIAAELPVGEVVSMTFCLPGVNETWDLRAVMRHRRGFHYGFEFLSLGENRLAVLKNYLQRLTRAD